MYRAFYMNISKNGGTYMYHSVHSYELHFPCTLQKPVSHKVPLHSTQRLQHNTMADVFTVRYGLNTPSFFINILPFAVIFPPEARAGMMQDLCSYRRTDRHFPPYMLSRQNCLLPVVYLTRYQKALSVGLQAKSSSMKINDQRTAKRKDSS